LSFKVDYGPLVEIQMQPDEIEYVTGLITQMPPDGLFVEWGSGGSTIKWAETLREQQKLITIEHNRLWWRKVTQYISERPDLADKINYLFRGVKHGFDHGYGHVLEEHPHGLDDYMFPVPEIFNGNVFFVDGIGRATIALLLKYMAKDPDSIIMIHDYYGREHWYSWATQYFSKVEQVGTTLTRLYR